jgi:hypothetical protein
MNSDCEKFEQSWCHDVPAGNGQQENKREVRAIEPDQAIADRPR